MKTIEERARKYTKGQRYRLTAYKAYTAGASDQIAVDNDKAKNAFNKACGWLSTYSWFNEVADEFIKALEE